jgi:glucose dehydrogenase
MRSRRYEQATSGRSNKDNVKNLKLAYAVPLGGGAGNEFTNATPLAEDGFLYVTDSRNVLYKIDARSRPQQPRSRRSGGQCRADGKGPNRSCPPITSK